LVLNDNVKFNEKPSHHLAKGYPTGIHDLITVYIA